jgi:hypothetical protein
MWPYLRTSNDSLGRAIALPTILRKLPFHEAATTLRIPGGPAVAVKHHQIVLWVSITRPGLPEFPPGARRLPAVLDTGFNGTFLLGEQQLVDWAALTLAELQWVGTLTADGQTIPLREADVWIHPNIPGFRDLLADRTPFRLELPGGIAVWPAALPGARRLPLLGVAGLRRADLLVLLDCRKCQVWMRTPRRWWLFW